MDKQDLNELLLNVVKDTPVTQLREDIFKSRCLPLLFKEDLGAFNRTWLRHVVRSPFEEVDIIDQFGNILFRVPALRESDAVSLDSRVNKILTSSVRHAEVHSSRQTAMIKQVADNSVKFQLTTPDNYTERWIAILERYGYTNEAKKLTNSIKTTSKDAAAETGVTVDDDF